MWSVVRIDSDPPEHSHTLNTQGGEFERWGDNTGKERELLLRELGHSGTSLDHPWRPEKDEIYGFKDVVFGFKSFLRKPVFYLL